LTLGFFSLEFAREGDWDTNGLFYALGCCHGTKTWSNPASSGLIAIHHSSLTSEPGSRTLRGAELAGRGMSQWGGSISSNHHQIDLGQGLLFCPTGLTILSCAGLQHQGCWTFSASLDQKNWVVFPQVEIARPVPWLISLVNPGLDSTILSFGASSPASGPGFYRYFVLQHTNVHPPAIRAIELYGRVIDS
jgi:hypothetical protein